MARRLSTRSLQPAPKTSLSGDAASRSPAIPSAIGSTGPDTDRVPAPGDHRGEMVDVGADFFSAAELAALRLDGLPQRREQISKLATRQRWSSRERQGRGGGREFALSALPADVRGEILRRRVIAATHRPADRSAASPANRAAVPAPIPATVASTLKARQAERLSARQVLLAEFDRFRGGRSDRASLDPFVQAVKAGHVVLPEWARPLLARLSRRTLQRWLAARAAGRAHELVDRYSNCGRKSVFDQSAELAEFVLGCHVRQPAISAQGLAKLVAHKFPQGAPDRLGLMMALPSQGAIARFLAKWKADAQNAAVLSALNDPDGYRSKFRFALGNASGGIERPNQRWQIDASPADVLCLDGRHSIYVVVDVFSRRMMALVSRTPRTAASLLLVARAIATWGVPEVLVTDNGSDFTSKHFVLAMTQLEIVLQPTPPYSPEKKPFVERAIGTVQHGFMPYQPGYVGPDVAARKEIEARRSFAQRLGESDEKVFAVDLTGEELQARLAGWIANDYDVSPHAGLDGRTPHDVWVEGVAAHPQKFADPAAIGMLLMPPARDHVRTITRKGVSVEGIDYVCAGMDVGERVQVRLDPDDLGQVWVYTDSDPWAFVGIAVNAELKGLDRAEMAMRVRAEQDAIVKAGKAELRRFARQADVHAVAARMIGEAPPPAAPSSNVTWLTPALEEAARAVRSQGRREIPEATPEEQERHAAFVAAFDAPALPEEQPHERYARWKLLKEEADAGAEIAADDRHWLQIYPTTGEWKAHRMVEEDSAG